MSTKKYVWNFDLEENVLTKDVKEDFVGKVKPIRTFTMEDVARFIAEERTEYRTETIVNIMGLVEARHGEQASLSGRLRVRPAMTEKRPLFALSS